MNEPTSLQQIEALAKSASSKECTYSKGYIDQVVFACLTCYKEQRELIPDQRKNDLIQKYGEPTDPAALCIACSLHCHENHDIFLLHRKGSVRCDCGNSKFLKQCTLCPEKDYENELNVYDHNYFNRFCHCNQEYDDDSEAMLQCELCFDWFHISHACLPEDQYAIVKHQTKREEKEDSGKSSSVASSFYISIERAVYICKKCLHSKCPQFAPYLELWRFLSKNMLSLDDLCISALRGTASRAKPSAQIGEVIAEKPEGQCALEFLKSQREPVREIRTTVEGKQTVQAREELIASIIAEKKEEKGQSEEKKTSASESEEKKSTEKLEEEEKKGEEEKGAMLVSLEQDDYCQCKKCQSKLEALLQQLQQKQQIGGKCLLQFQPQQLEIPTPLLPVSEEKVTPESLQTQVADLFTEITSNFQNNNQNVPHQVKIYAAQQFRSFFDKFKTFLHSKDDSVVTEKDVKRFCQQIKNEDARQQKEQEDDSEMGGDKRKQQEGQ